MIFLGLASNFGFKDILRHTFAFGTERTSEELRIYLAERYHSDERHVALYHNGRSALAVAIKYAVPPGSEVLIVGFTCHAVVQAVKAAQCTPVFADINPETLHYDLRTLKKALKAHPRTKAIVVQNTFGIPVDITPIEKVCKKLRLQIIEDLAHCAGVRYPDGREVGTVGVAAALSFGKGKSIDTTSGGAVVLRTRKLPYQPTKEPPLSDRLRDRWYPFFGVLTRALYRIKLGKYFMALLVKIHFVQRSADAKLDQHISLPHWQAKLALKQLKDFPRTGSHPIRDFRLVDDRDYLLKQLDKVGCHLREFWYEVPVSPARYYKKQHFPEIECPIATEVAAHIINLPVYYSKIKLHPAIRIIKEHQEIYQEKVNG